MADSASQLVELKKDPTPHLGDVTTPEVQTGSLPAKVLKEEEEEEEGATPTPPDSSSLSSENGTITAVTTEEESLLLLLVKTGGEPGLEQVDLPASCSVPTLELSLVVEDVSSSHSALGGRGCSPPTEDPKDQDLGLKDQDQDLGVKDQYPGVKDQDQDPGVKDQDPGVKDQDRDPGVKDQDQDPGVKDQDPPEAAGGAVAPPTPVGSASTAPEAGPSTPAYYLVKWITWKEKKTPIVTQSENGPCPLLAIMNTLFLRWKAKLPAQTEVVTTEDLMAHLGECVLSVTPREKADGMELNFQQNMSDAMAVLPKLSTGLDVNVRFTGVTDFEYTPECIVFDLLNIPLFHGWLVDPQSPETEASVGKLSYNQLVEKIIDYKHSADSSRVSEGLVAEQFLESTATQLSYHGLCELNSTASEGEISVFFRNNHFSTMIKHQGHLYLLVTDQGFLQEEGLVWESLHNVEGDGNFCDSDFRLCHPPQRPAARAQDQQRQIDQDYLVAVSLQQQQGGAPGPLSDLELAQQLQQEEYQQQQQQQQQQPQQQQQQQQQQPQGSQQAAQQVRGQGSQQGGARRRDKDSDCVIL
ncbi:ubiquitin carboxyl-terminal hydrolase MINDY-1 isoform X2 [Clinocottus analis]|uniref:ubiquitin carboxyl-terminal hydrolase MINDY-1 isoform X2 n=1 Tax=Clinocottus analis TaxID=304258 RepID=UPI0035BF503A